MREDFDHKSPIPPERWGRDHWTTIAYAFTCAGRIMDRQHLRIAGKAIPGVPDKEYPTRLQGGVDLYGHDDLDCLSDAGAAGVLHNVGTGMHPCARFTPQGLILGQWLVGAMEAKAVKASTLTWAEALAGSGADLGAPPDDMPETLIAVIDTATGDARKTGKGAVFTNRARFARAVADLKRMDTEGARFLFDVYAEGDEHSLLESYRITEQGFELILGEKPLPPEEYVEIDKAYWTRAADNYRKELPDSLPGVVPC